MTDNPLFEIIRDRILLEGPMRFDRYMGLCLYHPDFGYYAQDREITGREGDFYTAPHVHRIFGATVANWLIDRAVRDRSSSMVLVELGPGNGNLAGDILSQFDENNQAPDLGMLLVEQGLPRRSRLEDRFTGMPVQVVSPLDWEAIPPFSGAVVANEFFDALPVRIIRRTGKGFQEVHTAVEGGALSEVLVPVDGDQFDEAVRAVLQGLPEGQRMEFAPDMGPWLTRISTKLDSGSLLVFDYGDTWEGLTVPWRASGTLRCFHKHQVDKDPYASPGEKDITAHVNFTLLEALALSEGFDRELFTTQASFLIRAGILDLLASLLEGRENDPAAIREWLTIKNLIHDEEGMGENFKAMVLTKAQ
jgi:SAM-dependent MidA family methyltransferase